MNIPRESPNEVAFNIEEDDVILLQSLIQSPAWVALKRSLKSYKAACESILLNGQDLYTIHRTQGLILGMNTVENLPRILVERQTKKVRQQESDKREKDKFARPRENETTVKK